MAVYLASLMLKPAPEAVGVSEAVGEREAVAVRSGGDTHAQAIFIGACGGCHGQDAPMMRDGSPSLALSSAVNAQTPRGVIQILLHGIPWREGKSAPYMPSFGAALTDEQVADLAGYLRATFTDKPGWSDLPAEVARARGAS
jgi:mono/diheme cytochrome c family protein